jgi:hypothetical protein
MRIIEVECAAPDCDFLAQLIGEDEVRRRRFGVRLKSPIAGGSNVSSLLERVTPKQVWKSTVVAIGGDPLASGLEGQSRKVRVRYKIPPGACSSAQF